MLIHFICRGNAFRSIIAEAYLKSQALDNVHILSSGTVADQYRQANFDWNKKVLKLLKQHDIDAFAKKDYGDQLTPRRMEGIDIAVCINPLVHQEAKELVYLPERTLVWDVADIGEPGRIPNSDEERAQMTEETYQEIRRNIDQLVQDLRT